MEPKEPIRVEHPEPSECAAGVRVHGPSAEEIWGTRGA
jgi:hypothetical protein